MSGLTTLRDDDGSATITTAGLIVALILVVLALTHGIRGTIASHHAKVVADLSAVAGAPTPPTRVPTLATRPPPSPVVTRQSSTTAPPAAMTSP